MPFMVRTVPWGLEEASPEPKTEAMLPAANGAPDAKLAPFTTEPFGIDGPPAA